MMFEKKVFIYSSDSAIAIIEGIYSYEDDITTILSKKKYLKIGFFESHSKILEQLLSSSKSYQAIEVKTNLLPDTEIYKLTSDYAHKTSNTAMQGRYKLDIEGLKYVYHSLIDSNFKDLKFKDKIIEKRVLIEFNHKTFDEISDYSFLYFVDSLPKKTVVYQPSFSEQLKSKKAQHRNSYEPIFGGVLTNRGIKDIFL